MNATADTIVAAQSASGGIPWYPGGALDPWNHVEAAMGLDAAGRHTNATAAYDWLARHQNPAGSWFTGYHGDAAANVELDSNFCAYLAVGVHHHCLATGDLDFHERFRPVVSRAIDFVLDSQCPDGTIEWRPGTGITLLAGNCSIHHALSCALSLYGDNPRWSTARQALGSAIVSRPELFTPKPHAMDWYYPVLVGLRPLESLDADWDCFVTAHGVKCVAHEPWVTGGETAELALTLAARGDITRARRVFDSLAHLRAPDSDYWTGRNYATDTLWPLERTTWTSAAVLLAAAALAGDLPRLANTAG